MLLGIIYAISGIALVLFSRSITTFFHEMGHAIPSLLFTKKEVVVCLGSYDDVSKSQKLSIGRLTIYFKLNLLSWMNGLCIMDSVKFKWQRVLIILGGPLASTFILIFIYFIFKDYVNSDISKSILTLFAICALTDLVSNLYPNSTPIDLYNGKQTFSDGAQLKQMIQEMKLPPEYYSAKASFENKDYDSAIQVLEKINTSKLHSEKSNSLLIDAYIQTSQFDKAIENMTLYSSMKKMKIEDNAKLADIFLRLGAYEKSLEYFNQALFYKHNNAFLLNKRGIVKEKLEDLNGAIKDFNASVHYNNGFALPWVNLGRIYSDMNFKEEAESYFKNALQIDNKNADAHFYLGKIFDHKNESEIAYSHFLKAEKYGCTLHGLDFFLANLKSDIARDNNWSE